MLKKQCIGTMLLSLGLSANTIALANSFNVHGVGGIAVTNPSHYQSLNLGQSTNIFNTNTHTKNAGVWGGGLGYQWDNLFNNKPISFGVELTAYETSVTPAGVQTPAVNLIANAATLSYYAKDVSWAIMVEPRLMTTVHDFQPYVMAGIGGGANQMSGYSEYPTNPASTAVATNVFANRSTSNFTWEVGAGLQHSLFTTPRGQNVLLALEYRYMDWGQMNLGTTASQTTTQGLSFGRFTTNNVDLKLSLQF